ncbi:hypothetical protein KCP78_13650 [Salmonella enterica subsp. enterica]|nr:hypothetical protein KCP78_13650 [Salmonella enterica subsp. enterica]
MRAGFTRDFVAGGFIGNVLAKMAGNMVNRGTNRYAHCLASPVDRR